MLHDKEKIRRILAETVVALCNTGVDFSSELSVEGLLGITVDQKDVFLVNIKEVIKSSLQTEHTDGTVKSRKRSSDDLLSKSSRNNDNEDIFSVSPPPPSKSSSSYAAFADSSSEFVYQLPEDTLKSEGGFSSQKNTSHPRLSLIGSSRRKRKTPINHLKTGIITYKDEPTVGNSYSAKDKYSGDDDVERDLTESVYLSESAELASVVDQKRSEDGSEEEVTAKNVHHIRGSRFYPRDDNHENSSGARFSQDGRLVGMGPDNIGMTSASLSWTETTEREFQQQLGNITQSRMHDFSDDGWSAQYRRDEGVEFGDLVQFHTSSTSKRITDPGTIASDPMQDNQNLFKCPYCSFTTKRNFNLRRHVNMHTGQGFGCPYCARKFTCEHYMKNQHLPKCPVYQQAVTVSSFPRGGDRQGIYEPSISPFVTVDELRDEPETDSAIIQKRNKNTHDEQKQDSSPKENSEGEQPSQVKQEPSDNSVEYNSNVEDGGNSVSLASNDPSQTGSDEVYMID